MYPELLDYLACPRDHASPLLVEPLRLAADGDIVEGHLTCPTCRTTFPIRDAIPIFVSNLQAGAQDEVSRLKADEQQLRDTSAQGYDSGRTEAMVAAELDGLSRLLALDPSHALLDLGCGTGRTTLTLARQARVTVGVDFSFASLQVFARRIPAALKGRIHLVQGDAFQLPLRHQAFERVVSSGVLEHLPGMMEHKGPILEVARILRTQGIFAFSIYNYSTPRAIAARLFPAITYGGGYEREGFHAGKIYFRRFRWQEIQTLLQGAFKVEYIGGMRVVPREVLDRTGQPGLILERLLQRLPISKNLGYWLVAAGRK